MSMMLTGVAASAAGFTGKTEWLRCLSASRKRMYLCPASEGTPSSTIFCVPFFIVLSTSFLLLELVKGSVSTSRTSGPAQGCRAALKTLTVMVPAPAIVAQASRPEGLLLSARARSGLDGPRVAGPPGDRRLAVEYLRVVNAHARVAEFGPRQLARVVGRGRDVDEGGVDVAALLAVARTEFFQNLAAVGEREVREAAQVARGDEVEESRLGDEQCREEEVALRLALVVEVVVHGFDELWRLR